MTDRHSIQGAGGGKGGGGGGHEADDTLFSTAYIEIIEVVGEGQMRGLTNGAKSIYLDDTPLIDSAGNRNHQVGWSIRTGWQAQPPFPAVESISAETQIGTRVMQATPIVATITDADADYAVLTVGIPRLMSMDDKGNINGTNVEFKVECQPSDGAYTVVSRPASVEKGLYDAGHGYFQSPAATYAADAYILAAAAGDVVIEKSIDGTTWTTADTVQPQQKIKGQGYFTASVTLDLPEGVNYLRWTGAPVAGNSVQWTYYGAAGSIKIEGKTGSRYQRQFRFPLIGTAPWAVKLTRISDDSTSTKLANELYFDSIRTEIVARMNYPNTALVYYRIPAKEFSSIPRRRSEWFGLKMRVPTNYDPETRAYTGIWNGAFKSAWTDNAAWCFYDICTAARYGVGKYIDVGSIDKWALYDIGRYCDTLVDSGRRDDAGTVIQEPRFTCNIQIKDAKEAFVWLKDMASIFRGMLYVINGQLTAVADQPSDPVRLFNRANVIDGQFKFSGTGALARKSVALVTWLDPDDLYNPKIEYVPNQAALKRYGWNPTEVIAVGCTSRGQAHRLGKWLLYDGEVVTYGVGHDAAFVRPGDIVQCAIPLRSNNQRLGGRLVGIAADGVTVTLDAPIALILGHVYQLSVALADGTIGSRDVIVAATATTDTVTLVSSLAAAVVDRAVWVLVDWSGVQPTQWRVLGLAEGNNPAVKTITAISHNPDKYAEIDTFESAIDTSILPAVNPLNMDAPAAITIENIPFIDKNGVAQNKLHVHWLQVETAVRYQVRWRINAGQWYRSTLIIGTLWDTIIKDDGVYDVEIVAISILGVQSAPAQASVTIIGDATYIDTMMQWVNE